MSDAKPDIVDHPCTLFRPLHMKRKMPNCNHKGKCIELQNNIYITTVAISGLLNSCFFAFSNCAGENFLSVLAHLGFT